MLNTMESCFFFAFISQASPLHLLCNFSYSAYIYFNFNFPCWSSSTFFPEFCSFLIYTFSLGDIIQPLHFKHNQILMIFLFYVDIARPDHSLNSVFVYTSVCLMDDSKVIMSKNVLTYKICFSSSRPHLS